MLERSFGIAIGAFVAAVLLYTAVRLVEAVLPALALIALAGLLVGGVVWWFKLRAGGW
jgi:xanthosine utilization system XapX-like protein